MFDLERHFDRSFSVCVVFSCSKLDHDMKTFLRLVWLTYCSTRLKWLERYWQRPLTFLRTFFQLIWHGLVPGDE